LATLIEQKEREAQKLLDKTIKKANKIYERAVKLGITKDTPPAQIRQKRFYINRS
jgi:hypothetical protein